MAKKYNPYENIYIGVQILAYNYNYFYGNYYSYFCNFYSTSYLRNRSGVPYPERRNGKEKTLQNPDYYFFVNCWFYTCSLCLSFFSSHACCYSYVTRISVYERKEFFKSTHHNNHSWSHINCRSFCLFIQLKKVCFSYSIYCNRKILG